MDEFKEGDGKALFHISMSASCVGKMVEGNRGQLDSSWTLNFAIKKNTYQFKFAINKPLNCTVACLSGFRDMTASYVATPQNNRDNFIKHYIQMIRFTCFLVECVNILFVAPPVELGSTREQGKSVHYNTSQAS